MAAMTMTMVVAVEAEKVARLYGGGGASGSWAAVVESRMRRSEVIMTSSALAAMIGLICATSGGERIKGDIYREGVRKYSEGQE